MSTYSEELAKAEKSITITPVPLNMDKEGDTFRGMYIGLKTWEARNAETGEISNKPIAHFYDGDKILFNMGVQLTRAIADLKPGVSVEIVLKELKKNNHNGKTKIYSITPLKIAVANLEEMLGGFLNITPPAPEHLILAPVEAEPTDNAALDAWIASKEAQAQTGRDELARKRTAMHGATA